MAATGLLVYAHPVSLPVWGLAVLLSLWVLAPVMPIKQKLMRFFFAALIFIIVITPFTINYLSSTTFGSHGTINYEELLTIMRKRFITGLLDLDLGFKGFIKIAIISDRFTSLIWVFVFLGGMGLYLFKRKTENKILLVLAAWWVSVFLVGVVIPIVDHGLANALKRMPLELDLIRSLRYSIPLLLLSVFYLLSEIQLIIMKKINSEKHPMVKSVFMCMILLLLLGWSLRNNFLQNPVFHQSARCWASGQLVCPLEDEDKIKQRIEFLEVVKTNTPNGSRIMAMTDLSELVIRYYALRPLVYSYKDGAMLSFTNQADLLTWWQKIQEINQIQSLNSRKLNLDGLLDFSKKYMADYLVLPEEFSMKNYYPADLKKVFSNPSYSLFQVVY